MWRYLANSSGHFTLGYLQCSVLVNYDKTLRHCWAIARAMRLISAGTYPGFYRLGVLLPLDGMLVHRRLPTQLLQTQLLLWLCREMQVELSVLLIDTKEQW